MVSERASWLLLATILLACLLLSCFDESRAEKVLEYAYLLAEEAFRRRFCEFEGGKPVAKNTANT
jgi:hypothetical protein